MSVLFGGGIGASGGYEISNSLRLRASASAYLSKTYGGAGTSRRLATFSLWFKRGAIGVDQGILKIAGANADTTFFRMYINSSDILYVSGYATNWVISSQVFRDPTAHMHFFLVVDTQTGGTNAYRVYINNVEIAYATHNSPGTAVDSAFGQAVTYELGYVSATGNGYFDGIFSDVHYIDGQALTPSSFGETNADGVWVPKAYAGTYGTNGFKLDFKDAAVTSGSNAGLGKDVSGNGNYWNTTNISVTSGVTYDALTDTPTNNYATINPLQSATYNTLSAANLRSVGGATDSATNTGTIGSSLVPFYYEAFINAKNAGGDWPMIGASVEVPPNGNAKVLARSASNVVAGVVYQGGGQVYKNTGTLVGTYTALAANDVLGVGIDPVNGTADFYLNGTFKVQVTGITGSIFFPAIETYNGGSVDLNFGQRPFVYTNAGTNRPASTYKSLCTANLPAVAVTNPSSAFKITLATEANIYSSVATARSGWSAYVDILKNRDALESWAWQFSHDSANEYAISGNTRTYQAVRTQSGSQNWVGYSIRIGAAYGTAAGSVSHTNGADTTVTHSVGVSARQMIFLFPRSNGTTVKVYHPDLSSGKLLDLCSNVAEATDATIKTVTSTSFKIDSTMATGTYDYLVLSEISGLLALGKYTGNSSADGAFAYSGVTPAAFILKDIITGGDEWEMYDGSREPYNYMGQYLRPATTNAEAARSERVDRIAGGHKMRANIQTNVSGNTHIYAHFAAHPFGGSNVSPAPAR